MLAHASDGRQRPPCEVLRAADDAAGTLAAQLLEWPLAQQLRRHVHDRIDAHELPVRHETRRSGRPFTLVLEKTRALFEREAAARRSWQADRDWLAKLAGARRS